MAKKINKSKTAYSGKYLSIDGNTYTLVPELDSHACRGCDRLMSHCSPEVTELCTQGFILKKLKFANHDTE